MKYHFNGQDLFPRADQAGYSLVDIRFSDMENIRLWRNAQQEVLRQMAPISAAEQQRYFETEVKQSFETPHPKIILCSYLLHNHCIGYGGLTNIEWISRRAEVSVLMDTKRAADEFLYSKDLWHFLNLISETAFQALRFHRLFAEAYSFRTSTIAVFKKFGFEHEGTMRDHIFKNGRWHDSIILGLLNF